MRITKEQLLKFAEEVRDLAHHAANCAPLHRLDPRDAIMNIKLGVLIDQLYGDAFDEDDLEGKAELAALREAAETFRSLAIIDHRWAGADGALRAALTDTAAAAEEYKQHVQAEALREAAEMCEASAGRTTSKYRPRTLDDERASAAHLHDAKMLRTRAAEIEGGR